MKLPLHPLFVLLRSTNCEQKKEKFKFCCENKVYRLHELKKKTEADDMLGFVQDDFTHLSQQQQQQQQQHVNMSLCDKT